MPIIKVITGMRRVGKSCLLKLVIERLSMGDVEAQQIVYINKVPRYDIKGRRLLELHEKILPW